MSFAILKNLTLILSGREKVNYKKCVLANLGFYADIRVATIIRIICGIAGPRHGMPNLQHLAATDCDYHCSLCKMAYSKA